ncbi:amino acid permease-domain-containing protein [Lasiosphaeris hirsuta]|uniref:Amino acid permease-domain-containing protein n=1 Tax=Lasiosphaeris hirsuta TaxID=260670 RepID=A0AA40E9L3_9PEZI|nr:amino acid permease-domain-containing protein [Lasiosphaeris hirsuta]
MSSNWRRPFSSLDEELPNEPAPVASVSHSHSELSDGSLKYTLEKGGNDSPPAYQEATGAPVERNSPLGYSVGPMIIIFLNISKMIGTGVFSTPSAVLKGTGSVGLALVYWALGFLTSIASFSVYLEYASYFPNRSGSDVVHLEQTYPRPRWLFPTAYAFNAVALSFSSGNAIVLADYMFRIGGHVPSPWEVKGVAVAGYTVALLCVIFHTRFAYQLSNGIGLIKVLTLVFISIAGLVVLGGLVPRVSNPHANFVDPFEGFEGRPTPYGLTTAMYRIIFSYGGFENAFNVVNEVKNPVKQLRRHGFLSLAIVAVLYLLANIAYFAAVPKEDLRAAKQITASLFFTNVFGSSNAVRGFNFLIVLSAFGNIVAGMLGTSRLIRECGRQGVLPFPWIWASTRPFGTPLRPYVIKYAFNILMILTLPADDAIHFITDIQIYPSAFFFLLLAAGIYIIRYRRRCLGLPRAEFHAWGPIIVFNILINLYGGLFAGDVSFWYATYVVVGIAILVGCGVYYYFWVSLMPKLRGYRIRQVVLDVDDGAAQSHKLVKVPVEELAEWDATHDAVGRTRGSGGSQDDAEGKAPVTKAGSAC